MAIQSNDHLNPRIHSDDDISEYSDELFLNMDIFEENRHLNARRKIENYYDEKILLNQLQDVFTDELD